MSKGFVYVMINPSLPDMVKVGKTERSPQERAQELSSATGVPTAFISVYHELFEDCDKAEKFIHEKLSSQQMRVSENREFFQITPKEAIDALISVRSYFSCHDSAPVSRKTKTKQGSQKVAEHEDSPADIMFIQGKNALTGDCPEGHDMQHAIKLLEKAIKLGSKEAYVLLGYIYYFRIGMAKWIKPSRHKASREIGKDKNIEKGLSIWRAGVRNNSPYCRFMISKNEDNTSIPNDWFEYIEDESIGVSTAVVILKKICQRTSFKSNIKKLLSRIDDDKLRRLSDIFNNEIRKKKNGNKVYVSMSVGDFFNDKLSKLNTSLNKNISYGCHDNPYLIKSNSPCYQYDQVFERGGCKIKTEFSQSQAQYRGCN